MRPTWWTRPDPCSRASWPPARQPSRLTCRCHKRVGFDRPLVLLDAFIQPVARVSALLERHSDGRAGPDHAQGARGAEARAELLVFHVDRDRIRLGRNLVLPTLRAEIYLHRILLAAVELPVRR